MDPLDVQSTFHLYAMPHHYLIAGLLLLMMVLAGAAIQRSSMSTSMIYLGAGWIAGILGGAHLVDTANHAKGLEVLTEVAVILSLFSAGLKLRKSLRSPLWRLPVMLASLSMVMTAGLVALAAWLLGLPVGAAILLGAILAPTDPVLAAEVQVAYPGDTNRLRFTLTGEAGLNDGTAFPLVMLGLGLLGLHPLGPFGLAWLGIDVLWAIAAGLGTGLLVGKAVGRLVVWLRLAYRQAMGYDDFLALGLVATSYGLALSIGAYGFLAVFAAGLALRTVERDLSVPGDAPADLAHMPAPPEEAASHPRLAPAYMAAAVLDFNEQVERLGELAVMLVTGAMLAHTPLSMEALLFSLLLLLVIRPVAVAPLALAAGMDRREAALLSWFGIRGIGSLYYLLFAINKGLAPDLALELTQIVLCTITLSVLAHGLSVAPLMKRFAGGIPRGKAVGAAGHQAGP